MAHPLNDGEPPDDLVQQINMQHLIATPLAAADLLFVFGTRDGVPEFTEAIAALWNGGYCRHVLISGGLTPGDDEAEAIVIRRAIIGAGVPDRIVMIEPHATNTGENVIFSLPVIEQRIGLGNIRSVIALGKVCTSIRYLMTLERYWPDVRKMLYAVNYFGHPVADWPKHRFARERIMTEWMKIAPYKARGFISDWPGPVDCDVTRSVK